MSIWTVLGCKGICKAAHHRLGEDMLSFRILFEVLPDPCPPGQLKGRLPNLHTLRKLQPWKVTVIPCKHAQLCRQHFSRDALQSIKHGLSNQES